MTDNMEEATLRGSVTAINNDLSVEVIQRAEGDLAANLRIDGTLSQLIEQNTDVLSKYLDVKNTQGMDHLELVNYFNAFSTEIGNSLFQLNQSIELERDTRVAKYTELHEDVQKYVQMLSDISMDSQQITMDSGEIRLGAWTILSQAREWDLEILTKITNLKTSTQTELNVALDEFQAQLPTKENIISDAIEQISNAPIIINLDNLLASNIADVSALAGELSTKVASIQQAAMTNAQEAADNLQLRISEVEGQILSEESARIDAVVRESAIRAASVQQTSDDIQAVGIAVDTMEVSVANIQGELSSMASTLEGVEVLTKPLKASGSWKVSGSSKGATSYTLRNAQIDADKVLSEKIDTLSAEIDNTVAIAIDSLTTQVTNIDGRVTATSTSLTALQTTVGEHTASLQVQGQAIDGIKAEYTIKLDVNGLVSGIGLVNDGQTSATGINANYFYVGSPTDNKKPFMINTTEVTLSGVTYPEGTWIDTALIADATIGTAHIQNASITNAKIVDLDAAKITVGTLDANRIAANSISADKLVLGDTSNLWPNPYFDNKGVYPINGRAAWNNNVAEAQGNTIQLWGRDHIAPWSSHIPLKAGDTFVIEYVGGRNGGPARGLNAGLWIYDDLGNVGTVPFQSVGSTVLADLGGGWFRFRHTIQVVNNGSGRLAAYGCLYFQIEQADNAADPTYWSVGNVSIRRMNGGELIVNGSITADKLQVTDLSAISANLGTIQVGSANIGNLAIDTLHIKDRAVTVPLGFQQTISNADFTGNVGNEWTKDISINFPGIETIGVNSFCTLFFRSDFVFRSDVADNLVIEVYIGNVLVGAVSSVNIPGDLIWGNVYYAQEGGGFNMWLPTGVKYSAQVMEQGSIQIAFNMPSGMTSSSALKFRFRNKGGNRSVTTAGSYVNLYLVEFKK